MAEKQKGNSSLLAIFGTFFLEHSDDASTTPAAQNNTASSLKRGKERGGRGEEEGHQLLQRPCATRASSAVFPARVLAPPSPPTTNSPVFV